MLSFHPPCPSCMTLNRSKSIWTLTRSPVENFSLSCCLEEDSCCLCCLEGSCIEGGLPRTGRCNGKYRSPSPGVSALMSTFERGKRNQRMKCITKGELTNFSFVADPVDILFTRMTPSYFRNTSLKQNNYGEKDSYTDNYKKKNLARMGNRE